MKFPISNSPAPGRAVSPLTAGRVLARGRRAEDCAPYHAAPKRRAGGFTMIEIAISLAIVGFALVAIIGVLPYGMNTQRDNREETVINQDATVLIETLRNGAYGYDGLTNNVIAITNHLQFYDNQGQPNGGVHTAGYTFSAASYDGAPNSYYLTNGARIIGLLSTPQFTDGTGGDTVTEIFGRGYVSNHITAYVRSLSGLAVDKPPQDNALLRDDAFTYRIYVVNAPLPQNTNDAFQGFVKQLAANQRELRLAFSWPLQPNGSTGGGRHSYRSTVGGQLLKTNDFFGMPLYFYQPQSFKSQ